MSHTNDVSDELVRRIAQLTYADPRTIRRALSGQPVTGRVGERIRVALAALQSVGTHTPAPIGQVS